MSVYRCLPHRLYTAVFWFLSGQPHPQEGRHYPVEKEIDSPFMSRGRCYKGNGQVASHLSSGWLALGPM